MAVLPIPVRQALRAHWLLATFLVAGLVLRMLATGVVIAQHLAGLAIGVAIYALARRLTVYRWLAALAAAPILLDAHQVQIEQNIMAETTFDVLLVGVLWMLLG